MMKNVPQGWRIEKLGNLGKIRTGKKDANHNTPDGEYEFFTCAAEPLKSKTYSFDGKSLIMAGNGANVGLVLYYEGKFEAYQRTYVANELSENPKYIYYHLKRFWSSHNDLKQFGSATNYIKLENLTDYPIQIPPLPQQEKIVSVLDTASALVEKQKALLEKYDLFLKSKFIEMFGDPVKNPMGWEVVKLEALGKWSSGGTPTRTKPEYFQGDIDWYSAGELNFLHTKRSIEKITTEALQKSSAKLFKQGTLLIGMYDTAAFKMSILSFDAATNQAIANIEHNPQLVNVYYLYYAFLQTKEEYLLSRVGVRQQNLSLSKIKNFTTILPPLDLQNQFAQIVEQIEVLKQKEQQKLEKLQTLYDALMKRAFDGEIG